MPLDNDIKRMFVSRGMQYVFQNIDNLRKHRLVGFGVTGAFDGEPKEVAAFSLKLIDALRQKHEREKHGESQLASRGLAISDSLVCHYAYKMLEGIKLNDKKIPDELMELLALVLGETKNNQVGSDQKERDRREDILIEAAYLMHRNKSYSARNVAKALKISPSTVTRKFPENTLEEQARETLDIWKSSKGLFNGYSTDIRNQIGIALYYMNFFDFLGLRNGKSK